jgi:hypothetical protein
MSTIENIVTTELRNAGLGNYTRQAAPVINALKAHEELVISRAREKMGELGLDEARQQDVLTYIGLVPAVDPAQAQAQAGSNDPRLDRLIEQVETLTQFARENGFRA